MRAGPIKDLGTQVYSSDRFLVNKLMTPRRWDLVTFNSLQDPSVKYVKRLIGLPGEEVVIKEGMIWIDGTKMEPPEEISKLTYLASAEAWGSVERPAQLGDDEFYLLGDFTERSADSRNWIENAPGHRAGAIPRSYIQGVATVIYWPPSRWRVLR